MFLTTHAAAGLLASQKLSTPLIAFLVGLGLHFLMDIIPHGDEEFAERGRDIHHRDNKVLYWSLIDMAVVFIFAFLIALRKIPGDPATMAMGVLGSILPDFFTNLDNQIEKLISDRRKSFFTKARDWLLLRPLLKRHYKLHSFFHNLINKKISLRYGLLTQVAILMACIVLEIVFFI